MLFCFTIALCYIEIKLDEMNNILDETSFYAEMLPISARCFCMKIVKCADNTIYMHRNISSVKLEVQVSYVTVFLKLFQIIHDYFDLAEFA